jgi:hypothetical protein
LPLLTDFGSASSAARLPSTQAGVIGARRAGNPDFIVIKTSLACAGMKF